MERQQNIKDEVEMIQEENLKKTDPEVAQKYFEMKPYESSSEESDCDLCIGDNNIKEIEIAPLGVDEKEEAIDEEKKSSECLLESLKERSHNSSRQH